MTQSRLVTHSRPTRRTILKTAAFGSVAAVAAPYVKDSYAAGKLTLGCWDHWVPGANDTFTKICNEWGAKNNVEVHIDYITSQGEGQVDRRRRGASWHRPRHHVPPRLEYPNSPERA